MAHPAAVRPHALGATDHHEIHESVADSLAAQRLLVSLGTPDQGPQRLKVTEVGERALARAKVEGKKLVNAREGVAEAIEPEKAPEIAGGSAERIR